jgi:hypothetical protein
MSTRECPCSEKLCAQESLVGLTEISKITHVVDNRTVATSYNMNNIPYNVRGRNFPTYQDYLKYLQASLKYN